MYADRVDAETKRPVRERLNGSTVEDSGRRRPIFGRRQREDDDKWQHDLYDHDEPQISNCRIGARDLRLKLQKKCINQTTQNVKGSISGGGRDLREKLSGSTYSQPMDTDISKPKAEVEGSKPIRKSVIADVPAAEMKKIAITVSKKLTTQQKTAESVDSFLQSLGLEKYSITFQAEEVDMTALVHMTDDDLKALGMPMGPRKKILLALESKA